MSMNYGTNHGGQGRAGVVHEEYNRPRRPNPDTITYLRSLPLDVKAAFDEVNRYVEYKCRQSQKLVSSRQQGKPNRRDTEEEEDEMVVEYPQILSASLSALTKIRNEIASLAGDEYGSQIIETLTEIATPYSAYASRVLLVGLQGYHLHLAAHRYVSHVVQTVLQRAAVPVINYSSSSSSPSSSPSSSESTLVAKLAEKEWQDGGNKKQNITEILELDQVEEKEDDNLQSLSSETITELILNVVDELAPYSQQLAIHVCGSHVLRTLLCVLGGVELVVAHPNDTSGGTDTEDGNIFSSRRGRMKPPSNNKKKKKKKKLHDDMFNSGSNNTNRMDGMMEIRYVQESRVDTSNEKVQDSLRLLSDSITLSSTTRIQQNSSGNNSLVQPPGELQQLACHPSAGPLLIVLLRVLTYSTKTKNVSDGSKQSVNTGDSSNAAGSISDHRLGIMPSEPTFEPNSEAHHVTKRILCWDDTVDDDKHDDDNDNDTKDEDVTPDNKTCARIKNRQPYAGDVIYGLSGEPHGSHVLETILRTCHDDLFELICNEGGFYAVDTMREYIEHDVSNFVIQTLLCSVRTRSQADTLVRCIEPVIHSGYVLDKVKKRGGVLWRVVEMSSKFRVGQETILKAIRYGYGSILSMGKGNDDDDDDDEEARKKEDATKKKRSRNKKTSSVTATVEDCIPKLLNVKPPEKEGGRVVLDVAGARTVYHLLRFVPRLCGEVLRGVIDKLSRDELEWIAKDGLGSRCIMDAILDGPVKEESFSNAAKQLLGKLNGRWLALSVERVGHHAVMKLFRALTSMEDKAALTVELAQGINRLSGNAMGRSVIDACAVREFMEGEKSWKDAVAKQQKREEWLSDIVGNDGDETAVDETGVRRRKRKRKKHSASSSDSGGGPGDGENCYVESDGVGKQSVVESIMNAITIQKISSVKHGDLERTKERKRQRKKKKNKT